MQIQGSITALLTPMQEGRVDFAAFEAFIDWQITEGTHGIVPAGTTGESPTLDFDEHREVIHCAVKAADGRVPVIAGTGGNATQEAVALTRYAQEAGADAALVVAPYYNKPTQEGLYQHFKTIHDATDIPIILYNVPGRSVVDIADATIARLAALPRIAGIKDAMGNLARVSTLRMLVDEDFLLLSGEDMTALAFNAAGGKGCISVSANIAPALCAQLQEATLEGDFPGALALQDTLAPLHDILFCETSPGPAKYAASLLGKCPAELRLPLLLPAEANRQRIRNVLAQLGLC